MTDGTTLTDEPGRDWDDLKDVVPLQTFVEGLEDTPVKDRLEIVDRAICLLSNVYVHLRQKRMMYGIDPVGRLERLRRRIEATTDDDKDELSESAFHREMVDIFASLRDLHTAYRLPRQYRGRVAFLPFLVERYWCETSRRWRYVVGKVAPGSEKDGFAEGVEVLHWNATPIDWAVELHAERTAGGNDAARTALGIERLTFRYLVLAYLPEERCVRVDYRHEGGEGTVSFDWSVGKLVHDAGDRRRERKSRARRNGIDRAAEVQRRFKRARFDTPRADERTPDAPELEGLFLAREVRVDGERYGHLRIFSFDVDRAQPFTRAIAHLLDDMPLTGLIVDVRGNPGGYVTAGESLLQLFTPRPIQRQPFQFVASPLTRELAKGSSQFGRWSGSLDLTIDTGDAFSGGHLLEDPIPDIGQRYQGPVVLVVDALSYSTSDIFAAGFEDNDIGDVIGTSWNTGAGGGTCWTLGEVRAALRLGQGDPEQVPRLRRSGASFTVAAQRCLRVGDSMGRPVEDFGVRPRHCHRMTRADIVGDNDDLMAAAVARLRRPDARRPWRLRAEPVVDGLHVTTESVERVDVYRDGRPLTSLPVADDGTLHVALPAGRSQVQLHGVVGSEVRVAARVAYPGRRRMRAQAGGSDGQRS